MFSDLTDHVSDVVESLGDLGVAILVAIENLVPPIPSEIVLPLAGFVAGRGDANYLGLVVAATIGSVVGAWALYRISAAIGPLHLHAFVMRFGRCSASPSTTCVEPGRGSTAPRPPPC